MNTLRKEMKLNDSGMYGGSCLVTVKQTYVICVFVIIRGYVYNFESDYIWF